MAKKNYENKNTYLSSRPGIMPLTDVAVLPSTLSIPGSKFVAMHTFSCENSVPIYEVKSMHAFNQIIGHAKFNNRGYGDVYYRGECHLHGSLFPTLYRNGQNANGRQHLNELISKILSDTNFNKLLKLDGLDSNSKIIIVEGMLQHYAGGTRYLDIVDNHWVALWMGQNTLCKSKQITDYYHYVRRAYSQYDSIETPPKEADLYQYILIMTIPNGTRKCNTGIYCSNDYLLLELREALPSLFLRPHAQHGLVVSKRIHNGNYKEYDMANTVVGILKIRIDHATQWLGNGDLLTQQNLFPGPGIDYGYDVLLSRTDILGDKLIKKYY